MSPEGVEYLLDKLAGWLPILILVAICIYPAIHLNWKMLARFPERQPFAWGYFNALLLMLAGVVTVGFLFTDIFDTKGEKQAAFVYAVLIFVLGLMIYRRNRWVWLVYVIVSLNPISWIINGIYLKNRWKEMKEDDRPIVRALATYWAGKSTSSRALFAGAIFWAACVLAFIILFTGPYDDIRHDFTQMISVIIVPPALAWLGRFLWRKVVEPE